MAARGSSLSGRITDALAPLKPLYDAWMRVIAAFSWVLVRVLLVALFATGFLAYGIVLRLLGRDPLNRTTDPDAGSYWEDSKADNSSLEDFERQY